MKIWTFIKYSVVIGIVGAVSIYFASLSDFDDERRSLVIETLAASSHVSNVIGNYQDISVKKATKYHGAPNDPPYSKYLLKVTGNKGSAMIWVRVDGTESGNETVTVLSIR